MASKAGAGKGSGSKGQWPLWAEALTSAGEAYVETGVKTLLVCCQDPTEGLLPHAGGNFWISPAVVSHKHLHCPVRSKIRNEWFCSFTAGGNVE